MAGKFQAMHINSFLLHYYYHHRRHNRAFYIGLENENYTDTNARFTRKIRAFELSREHN